MDFFYSIVPSWRTAITKWTEILNRHHRWIFILKQKLVAVKHFNVSTFNGCFDTVKIRYSCWCMLNVEQNNSLAPERFERKFFLVISKMILVIDDWGTYWENVLKWILLDLADYESTLVEVMAGCRQETSHYLNQCWPKSVSPYRVIGSQWDNYERRKSILSDFR